MKVIIFSVFMVVCSSAFAQVFWYRSQPRRVPYYVDRGKSISVERWGAGGWYLSRGRWHHDGGSNPDTNYPSKDRAYVQLEDPEGVYERTNKK